MKDMEMRKRVTRGPLSGGWGGVDSPKRVLKTRSIPNLLPDSNQSWGGEGKSRFARKRPPKQQSTASPLNHRCPSLLPASLSPHPNARAGRLLVFRENIYDSNVARIGGCGNPRGVWAGWQGLGLCAPFLQKQRSISETMNRN